MTLVSMTLNHSFPIMMGDLLVTSTDVTNELIIPVFSMGINSYLSNDKKRLPSKLIQKIYVITDVIAISFTGSEYEIKLFLNDFINYFRYKESTLAEIHSFINDFDDEISASSSAGIMFFDKDKSICHTVIYNHKSWRYLDGFEFGKMYACGSGSEYFISITNRMKFIGKEMTNSLTQAIVRNYCLLSEAVATEVTTLETIADNWGGGFEMIYYDGSKFIKMDNITYAYWIGEIDLETNTYTIFPYFFYNLKYIDDILVITVMNCNAHLDENEIVFNYIVPPLYKTPEEIKDIEIHNMKNVNINNGRICNIFDIHVLNVGTMTFPRFIVSPEVLGVGVGMEYPYTVGGKGEEYLFSEGVFTFPIKLTINGKHFDLSVAKEFIDNVVELLQNELSTSLNLKGLKLTNSGKSSFPRF